MNHTTHLNLAMPELTDKAYVEDFSHNMEIIDEAMEATLPAVTTDDNGKFLRVVEGEWAAAEIASASGGSF